MSQSPTTPKPGKWPCERCGASREDQVSTSYYSEDHKALCEACWTAAYGEPASGRPFVGEHYD